MNRELTTSEVAELIGVRADVLRKWKYRGLLKLAPQGVSGQGRGVECTWSDEAVTEAREWAKKWRPNRDLAKARVGVRLAPAQKEAEGQ